jgi:hypothetical protein
MTPRQKHVHDLQQMEAEYKTTTSYFRRNDLRKGIKRMMKDLKAYDRYMIQSERTRQGGGNHCQGKIPGVVRS